MLYPYRFKPILKSTLWGGEEISQFKHFSSKEKGIGESWEVSAVEKDVSIVSEGEEADTSLTDLIAKHQGTLLGKRVFERFVGKFPLLIKFIDACEDLSIQVHPSDALALKKHGTLGKTEMWYIIKARKGASLYAGLKRKITPSEYDEYVQNDNLCEVLNSYSVRMGNSFFLPAGTIHAIGKGCFLAEIQQTSNITYRIFDYNRKDRNGNLRELHTSLAREAINFSDVKSHRNPYISAPDIPIKLSTCPYFEVNWLQLSRPMHRDLSSLDSFVIYVCTEGKTLLEDVKGNKTSMQAGETLLIPAVCNNVVLTPMGNVTLLECYIP